MERENSLAEQKASIADGANKMLESRRDFFTIGPQTFAASLWREPQQHLSRLNTTGHHHATIVFAHDTASAIFVDPEDANAGRVVSAAAIRLVLDWATNDWPVSLGEFLSGMFLGKPWDEKTPPWKLIPEAKSRLSADSLGFSHLYPGASTK